MYNNMGTCSSSNPDLQMGRKKSVVTRNKRLGSRYVETIASSSSSSSSLLGDVSPSDSPQLPRPSFWSLKTALPMEGETRERRPKNRRKRRSSGDNAAVNRRDEADDSSGEEEQEGEEEEQQQEMVTISVAELEKWQQRVIFHVEDHFTNEQLKRIAEFGRVHGSVVQEARMYVGNMEMQLRSQLEEERAALQIQAEEFVAETRAENATLRQQVEGLEQQVQGLEEKLDTLEQEVEALKAEKASDAGQQKQGEAQQGNCDQQQTHSPPNNQTQVLPGNGDVKGNVENHPTNKGQNVNGYDDGERGNCHSAVTTKQVMDTTSNLSSASKPAAPALPQDTAAGPANDRLQPPSKAKQPQLIEVSEASTGTDG